MFEKDNPSNLNSLAAFEKLRKRTISFLMSVRLSVRMKRFDCHCTNIDEIMYLTFFRDSVAKTQISLKSDKNNGHFT